MSTLDNLRKTAKRWLKPIRANDTDAQTPGAPSNPTLRDVQYALAREQGYESWADIRRTIDQGVSATKGMIQPIEMQRTLPMTLHGGVVSTTTRVWEMLCASREGDLDRVMQLVSEQPQLSTCQYNYTPPLHFAVREGHLPVVRALVDQKAFDPWYKSYPFGDSFLTMAEDRGYDEIVLLLREALANPALTRKWRETGNMTMDRTRDRSISMTLCLCAGLLAQTPKDLPTPSQGPECRLIRKWHDLLLSRRLTIAEALRQAGSPPFSSLSVRFDRNWPPVTVSTLLTRNAI
jgi:hypothetical protein